MGAAEGKARGRRRKGIAQRAMPGGEGCTEGGARLYVVVLGEQLQVEGSTDLELARDLTGDALYAAHLRGRRGGRGGGREGGEGVEEGGKEGGCVERGGRVWAKVPSLFPPGPILPRSFPALTVSTKSFCAGRTSVASPE